MSLLPVEEALSRILDGVAPVSTERVPLSKAAGRVLAEPLVSLRTQPPFPASAMDGYACRAADVATLPATLRQIGESIAGAGFDGHVGPGETVRIFTGAPVPDGADTIVIQENVFANGNDINVLEGEAQAGSFIRPRGLDFSEGDELLPASLRLTARHVALAAAMNHADLPIRRQPRIAILATGTELVPPGETPGPHQIVASNSYGLAAMVEALGATAIDLGIARDDIGILRERLETALTGEPDVIVTLGGASVGDHDLVRDALDALGFPLDFWKIAMRPGKPLMFAQKDGVRLLGLPGNPVSAMICGRVFLWPLVLALLGLQDRQNSADLPLKSPLPANGPRQDYVRAIREGDGVRAYPTQDSSMLAVLAKANALIVRPPHAPAAEAGDLVEVLPLDF